MVLGVRKKKKVKFFVIGGSYHGIAGLSLNLTKIANSAFNRTNFIEDSSNLEVELLDNKNDDYLFDHQTTPQVYLKLYRSNLEIEFSIFYSY